MQAFSVEQSIIDGSVQLQELFFFVEENAKELDAYEMEKSIFSKLMSIGLAALKCYFGSKGTGDIGPDLKVDDETVLKRQSGVYGRDYFSVFGKVKVPRTCYRGDEKESIMPLDAQANLPERCYSYFLQEWMDFLSIRDTFGESQITMEKLLNLNISASRFEVVNQESSTNYDAFYKAKQIPSADTEGAVQVISFDGKGVPVIKKEAAKIKARHGKGEKHQKKKEAMVGVSYTVDRNERTPEEVAENLVYPEKAKQKRKGKSDSPEIRAQNIRRMASLERSKQKVVEEIIDDAQIRDPAHNRPWIVVMDGALHLWALVAKVLPSVDYVGILDIIHVVEYLWKAVNALNGEKNPGNAKWVHDHLLSILKGQVGRVIGGLRQTLTKRKLSKAKTEAIEEVIRYFHNHKKWMRYNEYLQAGYPIGSGVVESTCGHTVKKRMEGSGRRWSINGAESTLLLRSIYTSNDWNDYWQTHMELERAKLYSKTLKALNIVDEYHETVYEEVLAH